MNNIRYKNGISERDASLLDRAVEILEENKYYEMNKFFDGKTMISPGRNFFEGIWNWDSGFHAVGVSRFDPKLATDQIEGFLDHIMPDGMLPDLVRLDGYDELHSSKPPVLASCALEVYKNTSDLEFLKRVYKKLALNESFWRSQRSDGRLFYYSYYRKGTEKECLTWTKFESGWDNSVRWDKGIYEYYPVDLNCFMLSFYESMGEIAELIGECPKEWNKKASELADLIEETFWNDKIGAYTDTNRFTMEHSDVLTPASFMPLYVKTASQERAEKMAKIAEAKDKFNRTMPTVCYDNPEFSNDYWRGPMWLNTAYFAAKGLKNYGFSVAEEIKENVLNLVDSIKDGIYENYDTVNSRGLYYPRFSWSACFVIEFILNW